LACGVSRGFVEKARGWHLGRPINSGGLMRPRTKVQRLMRQGEHWLDQQGIPTEANNKKPPEGGILLA